jgi:hypothetical protein
MIHFSFKKVMVVLFLVFRLAKGEELDDEFAK